MRWIRDAAAELRPDTREVLTRSGQVLSYRTLLVATGLTRDWRQVAGHEETLGRNGVTSNYHLGLAPETWRRVRTLTRAAG